MKWILGITGWIALCLSQPVFASEQNGWVVDGKILHPNCFATRWMSSDNFEEFEDQFGITNVERFRKFPGEFFGRVITDFSPITPSWNSNGFIAHETISLIKTVDTCAPSGFEYSAENGEIYTKQKTDYGSYEQTYALLEEVPPSKCNDLAPHIGTDCLTAFEIEVGEYSGGSMGWDLTQGIYGLFNLPAVGLVIVPLRYL